jgi:hypothetical protein
MPALGVVFGYSNLFFDSSIQTYNTSFNFLIIIQ